MPSVLQCSRERHERAPLDEQTVAVVDEEDVNSSILTELHDARSVELVVVLELRRYDVLDLEVRLKILATAQLRSSTCFENLLQPPVVFVFASERQRSTH